MIICLVVAQGAPAAARDANKSINTVTELLAALRKCWTPPPIASAHNGMEITVRFSIARDGSVFGKAAIRYESPDASNEKRMAYRISVAQAIERCVPFPITEALGNAIAGHPLNIKLTDRRKQRSASAETPIASADEIIE
jgi:hypothetical protein